MRLFFAVLLVGLVLLISAAVVGVASRSADTTPVSLADSVSPRLSPSLGVTVSLERYDAVQRAAALDAISTSGFGWVRQRFSWDAIEPEPGVFTWQPWDAIVQDVTQRNLTLVAVLDGSPSWARAPEDANNPLAPPQRRADLGRFAEAFAKRYGQVLRFYQVWDEPNIQPHWGQDLVNAAEYAGLLREAAVQLRAADPDAVLLAAALAPNSEPGGLNQSDVTYLDNLYQAGAAPWFDVVAAQPYGFDRPPSDPPSPETLNFRRAELLREVMRRRGDTNTPLWAVAYGWHAPLDGQLTTASPWQSVDEPTQAAWAVDAAEWARRQWPWLGGLAWTSWQPSQPVDDPQWGFALVTPQDDDRPVLTALRNWAQQIHPLGPGVWPPNAPAVQAEGDWRLTDQAADPPVGAQADNNRLVVPFDGTSVALQIQRGPYWGYFDVTVDGQPAPALPRDVDGRAILVLHDPLAGQDMVTLAENLAEGQHVAEIAATGGWEQWPLLGIAVWRGGETAGPGRLPWALAAAGLLLLVLGGVGLLAMRPARGGINLLARIDRARSRAQRLTPAMRFGLLALAALASALAPGWLKLPAIAVLFLVFLTFPETGPALLAFVAPLFLVLVPILSRPVNPAEAVAFLAALALVVRLGLNTALRRSVPGSVDRSQGFSRADDADPAKAALHQSVPRSVDRSQGFSRADDADPAKASTPMQERPGTDSRIDVLSWAGKDIVAPAGKSTANGAHSSIRLLPLDWPVLALLAAALVSLFTALNFGVAAHEFHAVVLTGVLAYGLVRLSPATNHDDRFNPWPVVWGLGLGAAVVAGWGIFQAATGAQLIAAEGVLRVRGPYGSPNNLALYLDHVLPILLAVALLAHQRNRRLAAGGLSLIILTGLVLTFSRGALFLGLPAALLFLGFAAGGRWRWIALALVGAGLLLLLPLFRTERFAGLLDLQGGTSFFRLQLWRGAWNMILDHPWLGVGLDNFLYAYRTRYVLPAGWQELNLSHPHNILLDFWTRLGVLGVIAAAWLFGAAFWQGWRARRRLTGDRQVLLLGLLASLVATLAHGLIDNSVFLVDLMLVFMLSLGIIARLAKDSGTRSETGPSG